VAAVWKLSAFCAWAACLWKNARILYGLYTKQIIGSTKAERKKKESSKSEGFDLSPSFINYIGKKCKYLKRYAICSRMVNRCWLTLWLAYVHVLG
jgi:hypothetical protein